MWKIMSVGLLLSLSTVTAHGQLVLNELMQSNIDLIMDDMNQFPDSWVEVYNAGNQLVNLSEYSIGLTDDASAAWPLPYRQMSVGSMALIYCDKEATSMHTDFRLESGKGGSVYLFRGGKVVDKVTKMKKQPAPGIAYGRNGNGADEWGYMCTPTPMMSNTSGIANDILGEPLFSQKGCVMSGSKNITLTISAPEGSPAGTEVRYTTDGSEPTASSTICTTPLNISKTTVVRAKLFCKGWLSPRSTAQSYIFHGRQVTLPVVSITTDDRYLNDKYIGIFSDNVCSDKKRNYEHDWRRPMNIELYEEDGTTCVLNQLIEARVQGGATRNNMLKSMALYANKRFGEKRLAYEFFPDQRPGQTNFKSLLLRNAGNDFDYLYMRDAIIQRNMASHCDLDWQAWRPAIVYINGTYRGILNFRERSNDDNIFTNYDELEDIDMIENWWDLKTGTLDNYNAFKDFYNQTGHTRAEYEQWMETGEFMDLMIANLFYCNLDFPGNNIVLWRPRTEGGRWRFIMKDTDFGLGLYDRDANYNTLQWIYNPNYDLNNAWANQPDHTRLFRRLMDDADFRRDFIDRCAVYMGDFLNERGTRAVWDPMYEKISFEYPYHRELINRWWPNYNDELSSAQRWISRRPDYFYDILAKYYKLGTPVPMTVSTPEQCDARIMMNGVPLSENMFDGKFFQDRQLTLSSTPGAQHQVIGWTITTTVNKQTTTSTVNKQTTTSTVNTPTYQFAMPQGTKLAIEAIISAADGIETIVADDLKSQCRKELRNGHVTIIRNGKSYTLAGAELQ